MQHCQYEADLAHGDVVHVIIIIIELYTDENA